MNPVLPCDLPPQALLRRYGRDGGFVDCFSVMLPRPVTQAEYVQAFYTTGLFKLERAVLTLAGHPAGDEQARRLGRGEAHEFAAWQVEAREPDQLLLADMSGRTRSWLMCEPQPAPGAASTRLYFGSAIVPKRGRDGQPTLGWGFHALLGFHTWYSKALLKAAHARLALRQPDLMQQRPTG